MVAGSGTVWTNTIRLLTFVRECLQQGQGSDSPSTTFDNRRLRPPQLRPFLDRRSDSREASQFTARVMDRAALSPPMQAAPGFSAPLPSEFVSRLVQPDPDQSPSPPRVPAHQHATQVDPFGRDV